MDDGGITFEELQLATRNHGMPLEALRYDLTPAGLHYLLIHYDIPDVDPDAWMLTVDGLVERPATFGLTDLRAKPRTTTVATMECAGNGRALLEPRAISQPWLREGVGTAAWTGTPLSALLDEVGVHDDAIELVFTGLDRGTEGGEVQSYRRSLPIDECRRPGVVVADEMNGAPLLPQHGAPARLLAPGWYGMANVKWLSRIEAIARPFRGYQQERAYRLRDREDDEGEPLRRIAPRALIAPPGIPDFLTRERILSAGPVEIAGRAWSGHAPIETVELSVDGGRTWEPARVEAAASRWAWHRWSVTWDAPEGGHELVVRARDEAGNGQPSSPQANLGGYANNAWHRLPVVVRPAASSG
jgi:DMSO/TMAO reductase YedYZ molybdopterin-dependent catalytic subunit